MCFSLVRLLVGSWLVAGWLLVGSWLIAGWLLVGFCLVPVWFLLGSWLVGASEVSLSALHPWTQAAVCLTLLFPIFSFHFLTDFLSVLSLLSVPFPSVFSVRSLLFLSLFVPCSLSLC